MPFDSTDVVAVGAMDAWAPVTRTAPPIKIDSLVTMPLKKSFLSFILHPSECVVQPWSKYKGSFASCSKIISMSDRDNQQRCDDRNIAHLCSVEIRSETDITTSPTGGSILMVTVTTPLTANLCKLNGTHCLARGGTAECRGYFERNPHTAEHEIPPEDRVIYCNCPCHRTSGTA